MQNEYSTATDGNARDIGRSLSSTFPDKGLADTLEVLKQGYETETIQNSDDLFNLFQSSALTLDEEVVVRFEEISKGLSLLSSTTLALKAQAEAMRRQADINLQQLGLILQSSGVEIGVELESLSEKKVIYEAFARTFMVDESEIEQMASSVSVNRQFLQRMERLYVVRSKCGYLLATEEAQTAGREIMNAIGSALDKAFVTLHRWLKGQAASLMYQGVDLDACYENALSMLTRSDTLYVSFEDDILSARKKTAASEFRRHGEGLASRRASRRDISLAESSLVNVRDTLAFAHQYIVNESELLEALLPLTQQQKQPSSPPPSKQIFSHPAVEAVAAELSSSIQLSFHQVLRQQRDPLAVFKMAGIFQFYRFAAGKNLPQSSGLLVMLQELESQALKTFRELVKTDVTGQSFEVNEDLDVPEAYQNVVSEFNDALQSSDLLISQLSDDFKGLSGELVWALEIYLQACDETFLSKPNYDIARLNTYDFTMVRQLKVVCK